MVNGDGGADLAAKSRIRNETKPMQADVGLNFKRDAVD